MAGGKYRPLEMKRLSCADMQVAVLMGGMGTRLKELTTDRPKPLADVDGKAFFEYEFALLLRAGFRRFVFLVGYHAGMIEDYFGNGSYYGEGVSIQYSHDGERLLGTGGAVVNALPLLEEDFLLIYADSFMDVDYFEIVYRYWLGKQDGKKTLMAVMENRDRFDRSNVLFQDGEILVYDKKNPLPGMGHIDYGIEAFSREVFESLPGGENIDLSDIQKGLVRAGMCAVCEVTSRFYEIGTPESLEEFREFAHRRFHEPHRACFLDRDGVISEIVFNEDAEQMDSPLSIDEFRFLEGAVEGMSVLVDAGYEIYVVTNQPAAAKGKTTLAMLYDINRHMVKLLKGMGIEISGVLMCPHHPKGSRNAGETFLIADCGCRKPNPGMITKILETHCIDLDRSCMVGDSHTDIAAGKAAGIRTVLLGDYKCDICAKLKYSRPDIICQNLKDAAGKLSGEQQDNAIQLGKENST